MKNNIWPKQKRQLLEVHGNLKTACSGLHVTWFTPPFWLYLFSPFSLLILQLLSAHTRYLLSCPPGTLFPNPAHWFPSSHTCTKPLCDPLVDNDRPPVFHLPRPSTHLPCYILLHSTDHHLTHNVFLFICLFVSLVHSCPLGCRLHPTRNNPSA